MHRKTDRISGKARRPGVLRQPIPRRRRRSLRVNTVAKPVVVHREAGERGEVAKPVANNLAKAIATLEAHGVKVYGMSWCGWSNRQRDILSKSVPKNTIYQEDVQDPLDKIHGYPTWVVSAADSHLFSNNTHLPGYRSEEQILAMASKF